MWNFKLPCRLFQLRHSPTAGRAAGTRNPETERRCDFSCSFLLWKIIIISPAHINLSIMSVQARCGIFRCYRFDLLSLFPCNKRQSNILLTRFFVLYVWLVIVLLIQFSSIFQSWWSTMNPMKNTDRFVVFQLCVCIYVWIPKRIYPIKLLFSECILMIVYYHLISTFCHHW